jgi:hypothetical protein
VSFRNVSTKGATAVDFSVVLTSVSNAVVAEFSHVDHERKAAAPSRERLRDPPAQVEDLRRYFEGRS